MIWTDDVRADKADGPQVIHAGHADEPHVHEQLFFEYPQRTHQRGGTASR